jgi:hypothetical protein
MLHMYHGMASEVGRRKAGAGMKFGRAEEGRETSVAAELEIGMSKFETQGGDGDGLFRAAPTIAQYVDSRYIDHRHIRV